MNVGFVNQNLSPRLNMGLAYVMTAVAEHHNVALWDIVGREKGFSAYLESGIRQHKPAVIGFSVNSYTFRSALHWAAVIKERFPEILLVFGGVHPTLLPEECITHPSVDMICLGDGEDALVECLEAIERLGAPERVNGIWYKDKKGAGIVRNPLRPFIEDLDRLPFPDWGKWDMELYFRKGELVRNSLKVLASRGCFHSCNFCAAPVLRQRLPGKFYRVRSAENVIQEIEYNFKKYERFGFKVLNFADPLFGADEHQFNTFVDHYAKSGLSKVLPWICETRPEVVSPEWCEKARRAGCIVVSLGIESADDTVRKVTLGKPVESYQIQGALESLKGHGIRSILYFILFAPGETFASFMATMKLAFFSGSIKNYFLFFLPLPGTPLFEKNEQRMLGHRDTRYDDGYWNNPNVSQGNRLFWPMILFVLGVLKAVVFLAKGLKLRGLRFLFDVLAYLAGRARALPMSNPYAQNELYQNTVLQYYIEDAIRNIRR